MILSLLLVRSSSQCRLGAVLLAIQSKVFALPMKKLALPGIASLFLSLLAPAAAIADEINILTCPQKHLGGEAAQEMMVKGVIMHTQLESKETEGYTKYTFVHTVRADWTIWICIQAVDVDNGKPDNLRLSCTACDY